MYKKFSIMLGLALMCFLSCAMDKPIHEKVRRVSSCIGGMSKSILYQGDTWVEKLINDVTNQAEYTLGKITYRRNRPDFIEFEVISKNTDAKEKFLKLTELYEKQF